MTASGISALERGARRLPYAYTLRRLAGALALSADEQAGFVAVRSRAQPTPELPASSPYQPTASLPVPRTPLVGRASEVAALADLIMQDAARLVTVTGVGGCGKTRLAVQLASDLRAGFAGGVWFVELAPVSDGALVPQVVATSLGVLEGAGGPLIESLPNWLRSRRVLLVLDNCEQVVDACAQLAEQLLSRCPQLTILATSREPLQIAGEHRWRLSPLAAPELDLSMPAGELAVYPAAQICARLEGIPLALELAAVRVPVLSVEQILARLDDAIRLLTGGSRGAPSRQQTVLGALDWSHALLTAAEQIVFRRLAVFAGGGDLEAVEAICAGRSQPGEEVLDLLGGLVNKSLVLVERETAGARYRLLEPVRQYAARHLRASGEAEDTQACHANWYLRLAERALPELGGPSQIAWLERLEREQDNLRAALRHAEERDDAAHGLRLAIALVPFWEGHSHLGEGRRWLSTMLAMSSADQAEDLRALRVKALIGAGSLAQWQADLDQAESLFSESLTLARALDDQHGTAVSLSWLGVVQRRRGSFPRSLQLLEESLFLLRRLGDKPGIAFALLNLGVTFANQGDHQRARTLLEECLERYRELGDLRLIAIVLTMLGHVLFAQGELSRAFVLLREGLAGHREVGDRGFAVFALSALAGVAAAAGQPAGAARLLGAADALRDSVGAALAPINYASLEKTEASIEAQLSKRDAEAARAAGRTLSLEQVLAEAATAEPPASSPPPRSPARSSGLPRPLLTRREAEVAELIERGCTDRQIAEALGISARTVGIHVQHLLAKLELRSRWQVTLDRENPSA